MWTASKRATTHFKRGQFCTLQVEWDRQFLEEIHNMVVHRYNFKGACQLVFFWVATKRATLLVSKGDIFAQHRAKNDTLSDFL